MTTKKVAGQVWTHAGDGSGMDASLIGAYGLAYDSRGHLFVTCHHRLCLIASNGIMLNSHHQYRQFNRPIIIQPTSLFASYFAII